MAFMVYGIILYVFLLAFRQFHEPHKIFILETNFNVRDRLITNIESLLYVT
jgi:hypothetical protein